MSKQKPGGGKAAKDRGPVLFIRLEEELEAALVAFIKKQRVEPDRSAVGKAALREFLEREGFLKPPNEART